MCGAFTCARGVLVVDCVGGAEAKQTGILTILYLLLLVDAVDSRYGGSPV